MNCILCNKQFANHKALINHYKKKLPCIKDKEKWDKNKQQYISENKNLLFNDEQKSFINSDLIDLKLIGIPGGGKTRCIIEKINRHFLMEDYTDNSDFLILSFSKRCRFDFINKGKIYPKRFDKNNVKTLHSLAKSIVNHYSNKDSSSLDTIIIAARHILENLESNDLVKFDLFSTLKTIYLDEAQDISESQFRLIILIKEKLKCNLVMVGDPNQNIYQFQGGSDKFILDYQAETIYLKKNYRSTANIVNFVNSISPNTNNIMESAQNNDKNDLIKIYIDNIETIKTHLLEEINNHDGDISEIAIIGPVRKSKPYMDQYMNLGLSYIVNMLELNNIKYNKFYDDVNDKTDIKQDKIKIKPYHINLLTVHGSKGLEFNKVILLNFHFNTFGILPTQEDYNNFKYLWYVGTSRAKYNLSIYALKNKSIWPLLKDVPQNIYTCNTIIKYNKLIFNDKPKQLNHSVTKILESINPDQLYNLEKKIKYSFSYKQICISKQENIIDHDDFSTLYGQYIEKIFQYFYTKKFKKDNIFKKYLDNINSGIYIDKKYSATIIRLIRKLNYNLTDIFDLSLFNDYKNKFNNKEIDAYNYLFSKVDNSLQKFTFIFENDVIINDVEYVKKICKSMIDNYDENYKENIFKLVLYYYQINHELGFLWNKDFSKHIKSLDQYIKNIDFFVQSLECNMDFNVLTKHPNIPILGEIDIIEDSTTIVDIKFTKNIHLKQIIQLLLYYNNLFPKWDVEKKLKIYNFYQSRIYTISIDQKLTNYDILKELCDITGEKLSNCIFIYDLETTSLDTNTCQIIERHFLEYNLNFVASTGIINIDTTIPTEIEFLTNITNEMIKQGENVSIFYREINDIFDYCRFPKFIAHNGSNFDHKVMANYGLFKNMYKTQLLDSKYILRLVNDHDDNRLKSLYDKIVGDNDILNYHRAEIDVIMLYKILSKINFI